MSTYPNCFYQFVCVFLRLRKREMTSITTTTTPHLVCVPAPLQGHINSNAQASETPPP